MFAIAGGGDPTPAASPALRLLTRDGRTLRWRPPVLLGGLLARARLVPAYAIWPDAHSPMKAVDLSSPQAARWLHDHFPDPARPGARARLVRRGEPATVAALRAGALLVGRRDERLLEAAALALGRSLDRGRIALYSPTGLRRSKVIHFVFEPGVGDPVLAIQAMAEPAREGRLRAEIESIERIRDRLAGSTELQAALPLRPLLADRIEGEYLVALPIDPLAGSVGNVSREVAFGWLRGFQEATGAPDVGWTEGDRERELALVRRAWERKRPAAAATMAARSDALLAALEGADDRRCAVHGDYWRGNIAAGAGRELRVFDWEWSEAQGHPALDLLGFEVGDIRAAIDRRDDEALVGELEQALGRVASELRERGQRPEAAPALLPPLVARLVERAEGAGGDDEGALLRIMAATERLSGARPE